MKAKMVVIGSVSDRKAAATQESSRSLANGTRKSHE